MSLGAMVAIDWASRYPEEIGRCVLINTSLRGHSPFYHRLRPGNYWRLLQMALSVSPAFREQAVLSMTSARGDPATLQRWIEFHRRNPVSRSNALRQLLAAARFSAAAHCPPVEFLLLASVSDRLVDVSCSRLLAARWGVPLREHPTAGHDLPLDDAPWLIDHLRLWLADAAPGTEETPQP